MQCCNGFCVLLLCVLHAQLLCHVWLFAAPWTVASQVPLFMEFPKQDYWSELPFPSPGDLPSPGIEPASPALSGSFFITEPSGKPCLTGKWISQTYTYVPSILSFLPIQGHHSALSIEFSVLHRGPSLWTGWRDWMVFVLAPWRVVRLLCTQEYNVFFKIN